MKNTISDNNKIKQLGFIERGTGKHNSNIVYSVGGVSPCVTAGCGVKYWIYVVTRYEEANHSNC